jgi:hypothetical protein
MTPPEAVPTSVDLRKYIDTKFYGAPPHSRTAAAGFDGGG